MSTRSLTIYRIRDEIEGVAVTDYSHVLKTPGDLTEYDYADNDNFGAKLFVATPDVNPPGWLEFLEDAFGAIPIVQNSASNSAVLVIRIKYRRKDRYFAIPFSLGRHLLRPSSFVRKYGLRVALNIIYEGFDPAGTTSPARVRSVDAKTVAANTLHTRRQADFRDTFETFGIDVQRDLLNAVTGRPVKRTKWGTRITGRDALNITLPIEFQDLGELCKKLESAHNKKDYQDRFSWIDNIHTINDPERREQLDEIIVDSIKQKSVDNTELAPPEIVDWDDISYFKFSIGDDSEYPALDISTYIQILEDAGILPDLSITHLRRSHRLIVYGANDEVLHNWPIFTCISGEMALRGDTYLLNGGDFFEVSANYISNLDTFIQNRLTESPLVLPASVGDLKEGDYNLLAANSSEDYLLLDKKTVRINSRTSPIEVCDLFTTGNDLVHVKRKLGSSTLSHLFSQGYVSGDLFLMSQEYRQKTLKKIAEAEQDRANETDDNTFIGKFSAFNVNGISPSDYKVVYAIVANWGGRELHEALPFFSKVNLRRHTEDLTRMGYLVMYKRIPIA